MFRKHPDGTFTVETTFENLIASMKTAGIINETEEARQLLSLPSAVTLPGTTVASEAIEDAFAEVMRWTELYQIDNADTGLTAILPFVTGGEFNGVQFPGMLPATAAIRSQLIDYAAKQTVAIFGASAFGTDVDEASAVSTAREFIEEDANSILLTAALDGSADSVEVLSEGLGIDLPEITTEDLQADAPAEEAPVTEVPTEEPVTETPVDEPAEEVVAETPVTATEPTIEIPVSADLPAMPTPALPAKPGASPALIAVLDGQVQMADALLQVVGTMQKNSVAIRDLVIEQLGTPETLEITAGEEVVVEN